MGRSDRPSVASKADESVWHCKQCMEPFKDDQAEVLECEVCEEHMCKKCLKLTAAEYKVMSKRTDLHWYCPPCESKTLKNIKIEKDVQERCREYFEELEKRVVKLEKKIEDKPDKKEVETMIAESAKVTQEAAANYTHVDEKLSELRESEGRKNNIIIYGLAESEATSQEEGMKEDEKVVEEILDVLENSKENEKAVYRLGKKVAKSSDRPRPIKIEFAESSAKAKVMKNLKKLSASGPRFSKISICHDMTKKEREDNRKRVQEARERNEAEESGNFRHVVVSPPWERRVVRVKKKTD